jgi:hypothetical protein
VKEEEGRLIFQSSPDDLEAGSYYLTGVQGYWVEQTLEAMNVVFRSEFGPPGGERHVHIVSFRSKPDARFEAATRKEIGGRLIFTDVQGNLVANFFSDRILGYRVEQILNVHLDEDDMGL